MHVRLGLNSYDCTYVYYLHTLLVFLFKKLSSSNPSLKKDLMHFFSIAYLKWSKNVVRHDTNIFFSDLNPTLEHMLDIAHLQHWSMQHAISF